MRLFCLVFVLLFTVTKGQKLQVGVYYEALCPASIRFITTQLYPVFKDVGKYFKLDIVPFGKATASNSSGHWRFTCQHGPTECFLNEVHSCVLAENAIDVSLEFINCVMSANQKYNETLTKCADYVNVSWNSVEDCLYNGQGDLLLVENGRKTKSVKPPILFIPTVTFNGIYNEAMEDEALNNLLKIVCEMLKTKPDICKRLGIIYNIIL